MDALTITGIVLGTALITGLIVNLINSRNLKSAGGISIDDIRQQVGDAAREHLVAAQEALSNATEQRLQTTTQSVAEQNRAASASLQELIKPLKDSLMSLDTKVADLENKRTDAYARLNEQVTNTQNVLETLRGETTLLSSALRRSDTRGRWGELQLRRIIELVGMSEHMSFVEQKQQQGEGTGKPDVTILLPGNRVLYIDSKAPMSSYLDALEEDDPERKRSSLESHAKALKLHVKTLSNRDYAKDEVALDYVIMFIPTESSLAAACEINPNLIEDAVSSGVVLASPTSLVAVLSNIAMMWREDAQNKNADEILRLSRELHSRLSIFIGHFSKIGDYLKKSVEAFNSAVSSFDTRVMKTAGDIKDLGRYADELPSVAKLEVEPRNSKYEQPALGLVADDEEVG
jgi:DNA recombination protein RmuC